jgi:cytochrome c-type biogenesis protein CcmF
MSSLGTLALLAGFVAASAAFAASVAGARRGQRSLVEGGVGLFHVVTAFLLLASTVIIHAFVTGDYRIKYVQHYSNATQPMFYKLTSYWGGLDGSILFWATLLAVFGSIAVQLNRERQRLLIPWIVATISVVEMFFLFLMVVHNNPFEPFLSAAPTTGKGLNPLLQNFYMAIHPPMLYLGFVGMTIPFAFGIAALVTGQLDDSWFRAVRTWTMLAWLCLTIGLALGGLWAYETLDFGGYWAWDPVENAALLPWFTATAFLHSVMVQERRGMLKVWNVSLVIVTFFLTIFGTFMTRSGVVQSVHAFGEDRALAWMFTVFMILTLGISFALVVYRLPLLRSRNSFDSWFSREASFLVNNWVLLFSAFFVLFATMFPTLSESIRGERLTVAGPFYSKWMTPIGLLLLLLTGVGPLLAWRKSTLANAWHQFMWPSLGAVGVAAATTALGVPFWPGGVCFGLCAFVTITIVQEFARGANVRRRATGIDLFSALIGLFARSRRRYGGYVIHLGIVLVFIGFGGNAFSRQEEVGMKPGQQVVLAPYVIRYDGLNVTDDGNKQMVTATLDVTRDGKPLGKMYPGRSFFRDHEQEPPRAEVAIHRAPAEDLYLVLATFDAGQQSAQIAIHINPLINWMWLGLGVMLVGTIIALLPERTFAFATTRVPEAAATTSVMLFVLLFAPFWTAQARAQHTHSGSTVAVTPRSPLEKSIQDSLVCLCGCGRQRISQCTCDESMKIRQEVAQLVSQGKTRDEVLEYFVKRYGSEEPLAAPIDRGFNRLAWLLPYATGAAGVVLLGIAAARWSQRSRTAVAEPAHIVSDPNLESRLDDELRDLD